MILDNKKKFNVTLYIATLFIIITLIVIAFIIYKYQIEGENTPPFKISKMIVVSTAKTENLELINGIYSADVYQTNDIKISIEKNPEYTKEAVIKNVIINNIQINKKSSMGSVEIYRPSQGTKLYEYKEEYKVQDEMIYEGEQETYLKGENLQIANQGGIIEFSVIVKDLNKLQYNENETVKIDGTLLKQIGIYNLKSKVEFDLIIELENDVKLKTKVSLDLPSGDITQTGIETLEKDDLKMVFKRI